MRLNMLYIIDDQSCPEHISMNIIALNFKFLIFRKKQDAASGFVDAAPVKGCRSSKSK